MDTNEQVHQPEGKPPLNFCFSEAGEPKAKKARDPNEQAMATNQPEGPLAQSVETVALVKAPPQKLANWFASLDADQTKKQFADLSEAIRGKAEVFKDAYRDAAGRWDELTPYLSQMQSLLSQRGAQRMAVLQEAGLPSWTDWFEDFKKGLGWKISLRAVQKKLSASRDKGKGGKDGKADNQRGYEAEKKKMQAQLNAAAKKQASLAGRVADLEKENKRLHGVADKVQEQPKKGESKAVVSLQAQVEGLKEFAKLAVEAFEIINGKYGERLMGNPEGKRLVEIAKEAAAMKGKGKLL
jgi:hypothetical protein